VRENLLAKKALLALFLIVSLVGVIFLTDNPVQNTLFPDVQEGSIFNDCLVSHEAQLRHYTLIVQEFTQEGVLTSIGELQYGSFHIYWMGGGLDNPCIRVEGFMDFAPKPSGFELPSSEIQLLWGECSDENLDTLCLSITYNDESPVVGTCRVAVDKRDGTQQIGWENDCSILSNGGHLEFKESEFSIGGPYWAESVHLEIRSEGG
jgi:hypothetical protein